MKLKKFTILTTPHCLILAEQLKFLLAKTGFDCTITQDENQLYSLSSTSIPLVISPQSYSKLPKKFIAFQLEQKGSPWFTDEYLSLLNKAAFVLEYSEQNLDYLRNKGIPFKKLYYCPVFPNSFTLDGFYNKYGNKEYDLVFYGAINKRRKRILDFLSSKFKILILSEVYGVELYHQINRARILLNIHYYEDATLETTRLIEAKALGISVISESSCSATLDSQFSDFVTFTRSDDIADLIAKIETKLRTTESSTDQKPTSYNFSWFDFYFLRFLLAQELISFELFSTFFINNFPNIKNKICLSLPESTERRNNFTKQIYSSNFLLFPGLRHSLGWIGCGYSYKFIFSLALQQKIGNICICEDDVKFPDDIESKINGIESFLEQKSVNWQVFCGLISDISNSLAITRVYYYEKLKFVSVNEAVGLVFSIFSVESQSIMKNWIPSKDVKNNTIDRYMNQNLHHFITCLPFLVKQEDSLFSTIWGGKNGDSYHDYIKSSSDKLHDKTLVFEKLNSYKLKQK